MLCRLPPNTAPSLPSLFSWSETFASSACLTHADLPTCVEHLLSQIHLVFTICGVGITVLLCVISGVTVGLRQDRPGVPARMNIFLQKKAEQTEKKTGQGKAGKDRQGRMGEEQKDKANKQLQQHGGDFWKQALKHSFSCVVYVA